jgi:hypothetical protein
MSVDPDLVRVDLLLVKRKLYNSYSPGSLERKNFLMASKLGEIGYLSKIIPPDVVNVVFDEYHYKLKNGVIDMSLSFSIGIVLGIVLDGYHIFFSKSVLLRFWYIPSIILFVVGARHFWNLVSYWWGMRDFKKEYKVIKDQIRKLSDEVKRIGDGK